MIFIIIPLVTLVIGFFAFSFVTQTFVFAKKPRPITTEFTYPMDEMVINLKDGNGKSYLKTTIVLGYGVKDDAQKIEEKKFQLCDSILMVLRNKKREEIIPVENTEPLKEEMKEKLNQHFNEQIITDVYITEFLIQ